MATSFAFDNTYARDLPGASVPWKPAPVPAAKLLFLNHALADELGLDAAALAPDDAAALFAGNRLPAGAEPVAQAYAGHQFGGFSPQLGDGRALLVGEVIDRGGRRRDIAFKGSGRTPFSRGGDGRAAVGPMLREVLIGEAMHALGIPTTRALAVVATGENVVRERVLPGAVLTRVAASHLRVGSFQYLAARGELDALARIVDYAIARHDPALAGTPERVFAFLAAVARRQATLVAQWMNVGFIHGVMNTDNMTISGETIDYGPCAFLEAYDPQTVFSSIDTGGRYAFGNQPPIARWNLARLAEALLPLAVRDPENEAEVRAAVAQASAVIDAFPAWHADAVLAGQRGKLGVDAAPADDGADRRLAAGFLALLHAQRVDHTLAWRALADAAEGRDAPLRDLFFDRAAADAWLAGWHARGAQDPRAAAVRAAAMRAASPRIVPRNHRVEEALDAASDHGDLGPFERLLAALRRPFDDDPALAPYAEPAPADVTAGYRTFCGT
jgi:uncharacterized protein YdiU (UPF0061 family)